MCKYCQKNKPRNHGPCGCGDKVCNKNVDRCPGKSPRKFGPSRKFCPPRQFCPPPSCEEKVVSYKPKEVKPRRCKLHSNYGPKDIVVVDKHGNCCGGSLSCMGLINKKECDYTKTVVLCLPEKEYRGPKCDRFVPTEDRYNVPVCEFKNKCVDVVLCFSVEPSNRDKCGYVSFKLSSTIMDTNYNHKTCEKEDKVCTFDRGTSRTFVQTPTRRRKKCDDKRGPSGFYTITWLDVPLGGDKNVLSFQRVPLKCVEEQKFNIKEFCDTVCIVNICAFE